MQYVNTSTKNQINLPHPSQGDAIVASVVIHLQALNGGSLFPETGRKIHGLWHELWRKKSPKIANDIHPQNSLPAFTVSPLMDLPRVNNGAIEILPGQQTWFRVTVLRADISEMLFYGSDSWFGQLPSEVELGPIRWKTIFQPFSPIDAMWSWVSSYQSLYNYSESSTQWKLEFTTPTGFSSRYTDFPIPLPDNLVTSWLKRWNTFCPAAFELPENLAEIARENLCISDYRLSSRHGERNTVGGIGKMTIKAYKLSPEIRAQLDTLFKYAFFCGSGHRTAQGMGMTRLL